MPPGNPTGSLYRRVSGASLVVAVLLVFSLAGVFAPVNGVYAQSQAAFVVSDIQVRGISRIEKGTVLTYVPVRAGDRFERGVDSGRVIRALYDTGLFDDVQLLRDGSVLIVQVQERPSIAAVDVNGNDVLPEEQMSETLRAIELAPGRIFRRAVLDNLETELRQVYFSRGQYGTRIRSSVTELDRNRVKVDIDIEEGAVAKIRHINIVGNKAFPESVLLDLLQSGVGGFNPLSSRDEYSRAKLSADTEKLRAWYLDRGYLKFEISSTQVTISPDKRDINITINVNEGEQYSVGDISFSGDVDVLPEAEYDQLVAMSAGDTYSRKLLTRSTTAFTDRLGEDGYAFARVNVVPKLNETDKTVGLQFDLDKGKRVYVRRIVFNGQFKTHDEVLRREMRQIEGSRFSPLALSRSQTRLQRLPYIERVSITTPRVPGSDDLVDIAVDVAEGSSGSFGAGAGFGTDGFVFNVNFTQDNLFGTGERLALSFDNTQSQDNFTISYTDPYYTPDGISRTVRGFIRQTDTGELTSTANFILDSYGVRVRYGVPLSEFSTFSLGLGYENVEAIETSESSEDVGSFIDRFGNQYDLFEATLGLSRDTRNRTVFATSGTRNSLTLDITSPGSDLEFYKLSHLFEFYLPLSERYTLSANSRISFGQGRGDLDELPFFRRFFAGGIQSVRGYNRDSLGPRDSNDDARGGDFRTLGSLELIFPPPFVETPGATRLSLFTDFGQVYDDVDAFDSDQLRGSYGLSFVWLAPVGPLTFSLAETFNDEPGDRKQSFQFTIGSIF